MLSTIATTIVATSLSLSLYSIIIETLSLSFDENREHKRRINRRRHEDIN